MENRIDINNYTNYQITSDGRVYNKSKKRYLKPGLNNTGYLSVKLSNNGVSKTYPIHRLVAIHFLDKGELNVVNHKDGNKTNNNYSNLEWTTTKYNIRHAIDNGLNKPGEYMRIKVVDIITNIVYDSIEEASYITNYSSSHLRAMLRGDFTNKTQIRYI